MQAASAALTDARAAFKHLLTNPVLGLPDAWKELGPPRALAAGLALLALTLLLAAAFIQGSDRFVLIRPRDGGAWFKLLFAAAGTAALFVSTLFCARRATGGTTGPESDVFVIGAASTIASLLGFAYVLLGLDNYQILAYLAAGAAALVLLQFYVGLTRLGGLSERHASLALPLIVIADAWGTKLIFSSLL